LRKTQFFSLKIGKIAENCDHNIGPAQQKSETCGQEQQPTKLMTRVARWFLFKPICVNFGGSGNVGIFYVHFVNFPAIWHTLWPFGMFPPVLVHFYPFWYVVPRKIWQLC
jgi:hypothetical protein